MNCVPTASAAGAGTLPATGGSWLGLALVLLLAGLAIRLLGRRGSLAALAVAGLVLVAVPFAHAQTAPCTGLMGCRGGPARGYSLSAHGRSFKPRRPSRARTGW